MEGEPITDDRGGPAIHIPEQGLHMRAVGSTADGRIVHRGTLDTSMGVVTIETTGDHSRAWARHERHYEVAGEVEADEHVLEVPDQRVDLAIDGDEETGVIETAGGQVEFRDRR